MTDDIKFNFQGDNESVEFDIVVEMGGGEKFVVSKATPDTIDYKINRVRRIFLGKKFFIKKRVIFTAYFESEFLFCNDDPEKPVKTLFETNLDLVKEENPLLRFTHQVNIAADWTSEELTNRVNRIAEDRKAGHQEAVNKMHFS